MHGTRESCGNVYYGQQQFSYNIDRHLSFTCIICVMTIVSFPQSFLHGFFSSPLYCHWNCINADRLDICPLDSSLALNYLIDHSKWKLQMKRVHLFVIRAIKKVICSLIGTVKKKTMPKHMEGKKESLQLKRLKWCRSHQCRAGIKFLFANTTFNFLS